MTPNEVAFESGRLDEALEELFDAIPKAKRARLFAAMSLVEMRAKHCLAGLILMDKCLKDISGEEPIDDEYLEKARRLLKASGVQKGD